MLIDASHREENRVVIVEDDHLEEFDYESLSKTQLKGNIYLAKVTRVEPSLQACFVEYGGNRQGFLAFSEIHPDYYQIPAADREALMREAEEAARAQYEESDEEGMDEPEEVDDPIDDGHDEEFEAEEEEGEEDEEAPQNYALETTKSPVVHSDIADTPASEVEEEVNDAQKDESESEPESIETQADDDRHDLERTESGLSSESESDHAESNQNGRDGYRRRGRGRFRNRDGRYGRHRRGGGERYSGHRSSRHRRNSNRDRNFLFRRYKIQEVIKKRQILLVQVLKEERGNKGAALTTYLSLAGRYCVLMPNTNRGGGVSRKIGNAEDRKRLKQILDDLAIPNHMAVILRTAGAERSKVEIKRDYEYLSKLWNDIRDLTLSSIAPALINEEGNIVKRAIRDLYTKDIDEVLVAGEAAYRSARNFMKTLIPSHAKKVKLYKAEEPIPLFHKFNVERQLAHIYDPRIDLSSGGSIVLHQTEALVAIDVNSGKATRERHIEETALRTNIEAAVEIARQLRLRDLAGLVVIDFIDMEDNRNNIAVERRLKDALRHDRARIQVGRISEFGLLEMSRQRLRPSLQEATSQPCDYCGGSGYVVAKEGAALGVLRVIEEEAIKRRYQSVSFKVPQQVALYLLNNKRLRLMELEQEYGMQAVIIPDEALTAPDFRVEGYTALPVTYNISDEEEQTEPQDVDSTSRSKPNRQHEEDETQEDEGKESGRKRWRGKRGGRNRRPSKYDSEQQQELSEQSNDNDGEVVLSEQSIEQGNNRAENVDPEKINQDTETQSTPSPQAKKQRSPRKVAKKAVKAETEEETQSAEQPVKKKRGRPKKVKIEADDPSAIAEPTIDRTESQPILEPVAEATSSDEITEDTADKPRRKGWWKSILE